jgi:hypothetical protein
MISGSKGTDPSTLAETRESIRRPTKERTSSLMLLDTATGAIRRQLWDVTQDGQMLTDKETSDLYARRVLPHDTASDRSVDSPRIA